MNEEFSWKCNNCLICKLLTSKVDSNFNFYWEKLVSFANSLTIACNWIIWLAAFYCSSLFQASGPFLILLFLPFLPVWTTGVYISSTFFFKWTKTVEYSQPLVVPVLNSLFNQWRHILNEIKKSFFPSFIIVQQLN